MTIYVYTHIIITPLICAVILDVVHSTKLCIFSYPKYMWRGVIYKLDTVKDKQ